MVPFFILTQNENKFWNFDFLLCTATTAHWPTPLLLLNPHVPANENFVLFVPKSEMTENLTTLLNIYYFISFFYGVHRWEQSLYGMDYQSTILEVFFFKKSQLQNQKQKQQQKNWKRQ